MPQAQHEDISGWASRIDTVISNIKNPLVRRVVVVESTRSTQDAAVEFAKNNQGLLLIASEQTAGRGSYGRSWIDGDRWTLPCTFVVDPICCDAPTLAASVACAVHETLSTLMGNMLELKIKWPNDIVVRDGCRDRKVAGILIEKRAGLTLVGIGINCTQRGSDWSPELQDYAISLNELGFQVARLDLVCRLIEHMSAWFGCCDRTQIRNYYEINNAMVGTLRTFRYDNRCFHGIVEHLDPLEQIVIDTPDGVHTLPIAQTVHERGDRPCGDQ
ncbi:MAG: biotin--[acetyl-CoA-carboxylase] ligase [Phycisphaerales bacterium JB052]